VYRTVERREQRAGCHASLSRAPRVPDAVLPAAIAAALAFGCGFGERPGDSSAQPSGRPNILFVVWDTVRADRMSLYGHTRATTPRLDRWAEQATVFEDAVSAAGYTVPSHASMFTGLHPSEHCASGEAAILGAEHTTLAEALRDAGYATFLYSENPHLSEHRRFTQGFERSEYPWSPAHYERALAILKSKVRGDRSSELADRVAAMERGETQLTPWNVKAAGELAQEALLGFLDDLDGERPFFAFVNYMEAHRPYIPPRRFRESFLEPADVDASFQVDRSWNTIWEFTFGRRELSERDLELTRATYDASLLELDELFAALLEALDRRGALDDTIVVLTADHGEHLGDQHMFDHQSTLYQAALRVPLVVAYPQRIAPGRRTEPVMNFDLFPTLLEIAGVPLPRPSPADARIGARSLLAPRAERDRLAEEITAESAGVLAMRRLHPSWDPTPWTRTQRALLRGRYKWIASSAGDAQLYDLRADPGELLDLAALREFDAAQMREALEQATAGLPSCGTNEAPVVSQSERELLQALGYESPEEPSSPGSSGSSSAAQDSESR